MTKEKAILIQKYSQKGTIPSNVSTYDLKNPNTTD